MIATYVCFSGEPRCVNAGLSVAQHHRDDVEMSSYRYGMDIFGNGQVYFIGVCEPA